MRWSNIIFFFIVACIAYSCIESYSPETSGYDEMLLIEGIIFDDPTMLQRVSISKSIPLDRSQQYTKETGALVAVECDDGTLYPFAETYDGYYDNLATPVEPEIGKRYRLTVQTTDNRIFESPFEPYIPGTPIDSITYEPEFIKVSAIGFGQYGLQFYANSTGLGDKPIYLRWLLDATYMYNVPYPNDFYWTGSSVVEYLGIPLSICWKDLEVPGIFIGDSYGLSGNRVADAKLNFVSQYGDQLMMKYSLNVTQLSISRSAYEFWYDLNKMINETGGLYENQPFRLRGNIECISDPEVVVSGVFEVAGVTEARIFAPRPDEFTIHSMRCQLDTIGGEGIQWESLAFGDFITVLDEDLGIYATSSQECYDCRLKGGTITRPPFWE